MAIMDSSVTANSTCDPSFSSPCDAIEANEMEATSPDTNATWVEELVVSAEIRITTTTIMIIILVVGITGNILVPIVIARSKDLRNSTNVFLVNLALADLLVILICLPTGIVELHSRPGVWYLGETMCRMVTFVELIAPHASVLTILAISFERYYAICQPFKAGYICTKSRAMAISIFTWISAGFLTSPIIALTDYDIEPEATEPSCGTNYSDDWTKYYYWASFFLFFLIPCIILVALYVLISQHLIREPTGRIGHREQQPTMTTTESAQDPSASRTHSLRTSYTARRPLHASHSHRHHSSNRARRQVVAMLGAVVVSFFVCLLPFRLLTLISIGDTKISHDAYFILVNFCRVMVYLNSAINPILYNLMSSKFRGGFLRLFGFRGPFTRHGTVTSSTMAHTTTTNTSSTNGHNLVIVTASLAGGVVLDGTPSSVRKPTRLTQGPHDL